MTYQTAGGSGWLRGRGRGCRILHRYCEGEREREREVAWVGVCVDVWVCGWNVREDVERSGWVEVLNVV